MAEATQTLTDGNDGAASAPGPYLVLGLEAARPGSGSVRYTLTGVDEVRLGRGSERRARRERRVLSVEIPDTSMSNEHARLVRHGDDWTLEDAGSKNGTYVNGARTVRRVLADRDVIDTAQTFFVLRCRAGDVDFGDFEPALDGSNLDTLDPRLEAQFTTLQRIARANVPVLVLGETGTGKELVARAAHEMSARRGACIAVNCGAIPATLVESELFGYRRGAFSGALDDRPGMIRAADGGTLFLDEIAELAPASQAALLRVLQEREVVPVGGTTPIKVDLRIVSATCQDVAALVELGRFRRDLHARISGFLLSLPPLRRRPDDLGLFVARMLARRCPTGAPKIERAAARALFLHSWPYNIRELEQALSAALAVSDGGDIGVGHLPALIREPTTEPAPAPEIDRDALAALLASHHGNVSHVAKALATSRSQVRRLAVRFGLDPEQFRR